MYLFIVAAAIYAVMLQCHNKFFGSQIREVASHLPSILAAILLYRRFGIRVMALALVAGGLLRLLIELPFVDWGYRYKPDFRFKGEEFGLMLKRLPSALLSEGVHQINALIDKSMASSLPEGAVSALNYGNRLCNVFSGLLSSAISTALFPQMVELISREKRRELSGLLTKILNLFLFLMVPVTIACVLFSNDLVSAVYERGAFQAESTLLTSGVFTFYSLGVLFAASSAVVSNVFYGFGDTKTPLLISIFHMFVNVGLNLWLSRLLGVKGLALATSLSAAMTYGIRLVLVKKNVSLDWKSMLGTCAKTLLASALSCGAAYAAASLAGMNVFLRLILAAATAVPLYLAAAKLMRVQALSDLLGLLRKKK
jgi:murein biosynthesis integral membrane protein MurJ